MYLWLKPQLAQEIAAYARAAQPNECCGVILGMGEIAEQIIPIPNIANEPKYNYYMDEQSLLKALYQAEQAEQAEQAQLEVIGFYHSHPRTDPIPSATDKQLATYPDVAYVIAGLRNGEAHLAAWSIKPYQVMPIQLIISADKPVFDSQSSRLTIVQKRAIIASAIIAFIFMLVLSLSLLPPAPIIPLH